MPSFIGTIDFSSVKFGEDDVTRIYAGDTLVWEKEVLAVPALSVPFHLWVARDINLVTGKWRSRARPGDPTWELDDFGTPAIITNASWATGVPVLDATSGGFFGDRTAPNANDGFSTALVTNLTSLTLSAWYQGGLVFSNSAANQLRFPKLSSQTRMMIGNGGGGSGRSVEFASTFTDSDIVQFDAPAGASRIVSAISAYRNGTSLTQTVPGTSAFNSSGTRLVLGGLMDGSGLLASVPSVRLLAAFQTTGGLPLDSTDRATLNTFLQGLRAGTIE